MTKRKPPALSYSVDLTLPDGTPPLPYRVAIVVTRDDGGVLSKKEIKGIHASIVKHFTVAKIEMAPPVEVIRQDPLEEPEVGHGSDVD